MIKFIIGFTIGLIVGVVLAIGYICWICFHYDD